MDRHLSTGGYKQNHTKKVLVAKIFGRHAVARSQRIYAHSRHVGAQITDVARYLGFSYQLNITATHQLTKNIRRAKALFT
eukprot:6551732-Alexandrium_andersonii.AAC.1